MPFYPGQEVVVSYGILGWVLAVGKDHIIVKLGKAVLELSFEEVQTREEFDAWVRKQKEQMK